MKADRDVIIQTLISGLEEPIPVGRNGRNKSLRLASEFLRALPTTIPLPELVMEEDDDACLDWYEGDSVFSVSVRSNGLLFYAGLRNDEEANGQSRFDGAIPDEIMQILRGMTQEAE